VDDIARSPPAPTAIEALKRIAELYEIEAEIRGNNADERRAVRQQKTKPLLEALRAWLEKTLAQVAGGSSIAQAIRINLQPRSRHPVRALLLGSPEDLSFPRHAAVDHRRQAGSDRTLTRWPGSDDLINVRLRTVYVASGRASRLTRKLDRFGMIGHRISGDAFGNHILVPYLDRLNGTRWPAVPHQPRRH